MIGSIFFMIMGVPAYAADEQQTADDEVSSVTERDENQSNADQSTDIIEEVVVQGIRSSLRDVVEIKRSNVGVMEAIVEDSTSKAGGTPLEAVVLFATNQDNWGFSFSGAYQERTNF